MDISINKDKYRLESIYSYPAEPQMKFNFLGASKDYKNEKSWKAKLVKKSPKLVEITAKGSTLQLKRTVEFLSDDRIRVKDTFTNPSSQDQGVVFFHKITPLTLHTAREWFVRGCRRYTAPCRPKKRDG